MAGIHRERPGADEIAPATGAPAIDLGDDVWCSPGLSNSYLLRTDDGSVVLNSGMGFEGPLHRRSYDGLDAGPVRALLFTQGHYDHVGGADQLRSDGTELIAQENFRVWRADNQRLEAFRSRNSAFAWIDAIVAAMDYARELGIGEVAQAQPEPTTTFRDRLELDIGGRELVLIATPGGETFDSMVVWLPGSRTLFTGNLTGPLFGHVPNLVTIRGDRYRDALTYIDSLQIVLDLAPERILTGHFGPIEGADRIAEETATLQEAMQWVHDRTVDGMNAGTDVHTLMRQVAVPDHLDVGEGYGKTSLERTCHLGELRRLVPSPLHHGAVRRRARRDRARPGGGGRHGVAGGRCPGPPRRGRTGGRVASHGPGARGRARQPRGTIGCLDGHADAPGRLRQLLGISLAAAGRAPTGTDMTNTIRFDFTGTRVLVTGGTSGIGHSIATAFADAGAEVLVTGTRADPSAYDVDLSRFEFHQLDIADTASVDELIAVLSDRYPLLDILVNNAGANFPGGRDEWDPDGFSDSVAINLLGPVRLTLGLGRLLRASSMEGGASVVNLVSMASFRSVPLVPGYGAAKAGMANFTANLAHRWATKGVRVNAIAPGIIDTPMTAPMAAFPELLDAELDHTPMGRLGTTDEVAAAVLFVSSASASFMTGNTVAVDGGYLAG